LLSLLIVHVAPGTRLACHTIVVMAQSLSVSRVPDGRQVARNVHGCEEGAESKAQITFGEGRPGQTYDGVDDIVRRAPLIGAPMLRIRAADLPGEADTAPLAASPPYAV
jgi:hypothetical protein